MGILETTKRYVTDFMDGVGRNGKRDKLARMSAGTYVRTPAPELNALYAENRIIQNVVDIPAEDMTRNWFTLRCDNDELSRNIMSKLADLNAKDVFKRMMAYERIQGDGFISLGVTQRSKFDLKQEMPDKVKSVDYLHAFSSYKVSEFIMNEDVFDIHYGKLNSLVIDRSSKYMMSKVQGNAAVHTSRLLHARTRWLEGEVQGQSLIEAMNDVFKVFDTTLWSVGQILYDYTFKVYKSKDIDGMNSRDKQELSMLIDFMFRTEALALIANDEELTKQTTNVSGIDQLIDFVWEVMAASARMPKSVLKGQESGTIAGAQYDVMNYYSRIAADQENVIKPLLERLIRLIMLSEEFNVDPESLEWEIKFNPLWQVDSKTDAEIRKLIAETDQIYIVNGVHTVDEVRNARFGQFGLTEENKYSGDSADLDDIARKVYKGFLDGKA
ncbi:anti-CBASS protein Acb1 family protein [Peribacillus asahii]|uniref:anti-CBASS protein Acb1 family protein n=1 Tax=Peribacillus asahii TaxID=228899 RepID=UPI00257E215B|nr:anti-CBASS Acb1 family protein [Peribacillus asahii]